MLFRAFQNYLLRIQLLGSQSEVFWVLRVPDWHTLSELHEMFASLLAFPEETPYRFVFEYKNFEPHKQEQWDSRRTNLSEPFAESSTAFYRLAEKLDFFIRLTRIYEAAKPAPILLYGEPFPPTPDCLDCHDYDRKRLARELPMAPPTEELDRRLKRFERTKTNWIGPYRSKDMSLFQLLVATLLERGQRPAGPKELAERLTWTDYQGTLTPTAIKRVAKRLPIITDAFGRYHLDPGCPEYAKALSTLQSFADSPTGQKLLVKRFSFDGMSVQGEQPDLVMVVEERTGRVLGARAALQDDEGGLYLDSVAEARKAVPNPEALVVDLAGLELTLEDALDIPVELRFCLKGVSEPFEALLQQMAGEAGYTYPPQLSPEELAAFCSASRKFYLAAPWTMAGDDEPLRLEGLSKKPLYVTILGQARQVYGLGLFDDPATLKALLEEDPQARPTCFMDFAATQDSRLLRKTLDKEGISYLEEDTIPFAYGGDGEAVVSHYRLLTRVLEIVSKLFSGISIPDEGTSVTHDALGNEVRVTWPTPLDEASGGQKKLGRNDPCWCGSGKKYKKCHGR